MGIPAVCAFSASSVCVWFSVFFPNSFFPQVIISQAKLKDIVEDKKNKALMCATGGQAFFSLSPS